MAKKKDDKLSDDRSKGLQTPFRPDDPRLLEAIDAYATTIRRSRNMAMVLLLEAALKEAGFWPPPPSE